MAPRVSAVTEWSLNATVIEARSWPDVLSALVQQRGFLMFAIPELVIAVVVAAFWLVPAAAAVWALLTLHRIWTRLQVLGARLETIERLLHSSRQPG